MQLPQLTFTRFVAALIVLVFHGARSTYPFTVYPAKYLIDYGYVAVIYFFALSGFILAITYRSSYERTATLNRGQFWLARFSRIYPLYFVALILTVLVQTTYYAINVTPVELLASLTLLQGWFPSLVTKLNGPGWSLSVEAFFYAIFPFLFLLILPFSNRTLVGLLVAFWLLGMGVYYVLVNQPKPATFTIEEYHNLTSYSPWMHLATFVNGCLSGLLFWRYVWKKPSVQQRNRLSWVLLGLGVLGLIVLVPNPSLMAYAEGGLLASVFILLIVGLGLQTDTLLVRLLSWRPLVYLGEISYGLYILQMPVIWLLKKIDPLSLGDTFLRDVFTFCALFAVTIFCYHFIERPAQTYIRHRWYPKLAHSS